MDIREEESDIRAFFSRLKNRDFSGNVGIALKNSIYQFSTTLIGKIGALILTIVLARLLMPEIFRLLQFSFSSNLFFFFCVIFCILDKGFILLGCFKKNLWENIQNLESQKISGMSNLARTIVRIK